MQEHALQVAQQHLLLTDSCVLLVLRDLVLGDVLVGQLPRLLVVLFVLLLRLHELKVRLLLLKGQMAKV